MTNIIGQLRKMHVLATEPVSYNLALHKTHDLPTLNTLLNNTLSIEFTGKIICVACERGIKKSYQQGYCFPCAQRLASCDICILKPQHCHYANGTCREPNWGLSNCFIPHIVYLANSSGIKVGLTRQTQLPTRWIDQGAVQGLPILRVQSRLQAGLLEVAFANKVADKTDWRKMLRGVNPKVDLAAQRDELISELGSSIQKIASKFPLGDIEILTNEKVLDIHYPVCIYPEKINSLNLDQTSKVEGILQGIKG